MELDRRGAELLFQVFTEREERSSIAGVFKFIFFGIAVLLLVPGGLAGLFRLFERKGR